MSTRIVEGFSVTHAQILDGATDAYSVANSTFGDMYGVSNGSINPNVGTFDNTGDNEILSSWYWFNYADLTVEQGFMNFDTVNLITGDGYTSSGTSPNDYFTAPLWTEASMNIAPRPVLIRVLSKDTAGGVRTLDFILYKVQFAPMDLNGPQYKQGVKFNFKGRVLMSLADEKGSVLASRQVGRVVSRPFIAS